MAKKIKYSQINSFTPKAFEGNPAGVLIGDELSDSEMILIARELNFAETAFISSSKNCNYKLRWLTPTTEVDLCGHATIAALHFLKENGLLMENDEITFETRSGNLRCGFKKGKYFMEIPIHIVEKFDDDKSIILNALRIKEGIVNSDLPFLTYNKILFIAINFLSDLNNVSPNFVELKRISTNSLFSTVMLFTLQTNESGNMAHSRFFAPAEGIKEDVVTGSANGPLLLILKRLNLIDTKSEIIVCTFEQGDILKRPGRVTVSYNQNKNELFIIGDAVTVVRGEFII